MADASRGGACHPADAFARGQAAWPQLILAESRFAAHFTQRRQMNDDRAEDSGRYVHAADLYLAVACLDLVPGAAEIFQRQYRPAVVRFLKRVGAHLDSFDDLVQSLFIRVLVGTELRPACLRQYRGSSALRAWIEIAAKRMMLNERRARATRKRFISRLAVEPCPRPADPFDILATKRAEKTFNAALTAAFAALSHRDRQLLRFAFQGELSTVAISRLFDVDHSTISRWLARARQMLRAQLEDRLGPHFRDSMRSLAPSLLAASDGLDVPL